MGFVVASEVSGEGFGEFAVVVCVFAVVVGVVVVVVVGIFSRWKFLSVSFGKLEARNFLVRNVGEDPFM